MKLVAFDIDGTLFDTKVGIIKALNETLINFGYEAVDEEEQFKYIGPPIYDSLKKYFMMTDIEARKATDMYREIYVDKYIQESFLYKNVLPVLETLKRNGFKLTIATMKTKIQIDKLFDVFELKNFFSLVQYASLNESVSKQQMLMAIRASYPNCSEYYMVGDTVGDYWAALNSNYNFIFSKYGYGELPLGAKVSKIDSFSDILDILY